ncbi:hypothetical protein PCE1_000815 [Barthelona sp. PCE]
MFFKHFIGLQKKGFRLLRRNVAMLAVQILIPIGFIALMILLDSIVMSSDNSGRFKELPNPIAEPVNNIPLCYTHHGACYTLAYVPNSTFVKSIIDELRVLNDPEIPANQTIGFATITDYDDYVSANKNTTQGGYIFDFDETVTDIGTLTNFSYTVSRNASAFSCALGDQYCQVDDDRDLIRPMFMMMDKAAAKVAGGDMDNVALSMSDMPRPRVLKADMISLFGSTFIGATLFLTSFLTSMVTVINDKPLKEALELNGANSAALWMQYMFPQWVGSLISNTVFWLVGRYIAKFPFFTNDSQGSVTYVTFFLASISLNAFALFLSLLLSSPRSASLFSFGLFVMFYLLDAVINMVVFPSAHVDSDYAFYATLFTFLPQSVVDLALDQLADTATFVEGRGITWDTLNTYLGAKPYQVGDCLLLMIRNTFIYLALLWYFSQIIGTGIKKKWHFPFTFWMRPSVTTVDNIRLQSNVDDDVREVGEKIFASTIKDLVVDNAIVTKNLTKRFGNFTAVDNVSILAKKDTCFGLLGVNGAGKTTCINCLIGSLKTSDGVSYVNGYNVAKDPMKLRRSIGICPQYEILWDLLTVEEHIELFCYIRGMDKTKFNDEVDRILDSVSLPGMGKKQVALLSASNRRKVAIGLSLVNSPSMIFLDEPTTGLSNLSAIWNVILRIKEQKNTTILLTSHNMEEVTFLADEVAIMAKGQVSAFGSVLRLRTKFGGGYSLSITLTSAAVEEQLKAYLAEYVEFSVAKSSSNTLLLQIDNKFANKLPDAIRALESDHAKEMGVTNVSFSLSTLEDAFLNLAQMYNLDISEENDEKEENQLTVQDTQKNLEIQLEDPTS